MGDLQPQYVVVGRIGYARCGVDYITEIPAVSTLAGKKLPLASGPALRRRGLLELHELPLEVPDVLEALVDRRKAQVRDRVERSQVLEDRETQELAVDLAPLGPDPLVDVVGDGLGGAVGDRPPGDRPLDAGEELLPVVRLHDPGALPNQD